MNSQYYIHLHTAMCFFISFLFIKSKQIKQFNDYLLFYTEYLNNSFKKCLLPEVNASSFYDSCFFIGLQETKT